MDARFRRAAALACLCVAACQSPQEDGEPAEGTAGSGGTRSMTAGEGGTTAGAARFGSPMSIEPPPFKAMVTPARRRPFSSRKGPCSVEHPLWFAVLHLFNHQTHHRGQLTTLFTQLGRDPGVTALMAFLRDVEAAG